MWFFLSLISENLTKPADLSKRVIFKAKTTKPDKNSDVDKVEENPKKRDKSKDSVTTSKLSFSVEDESYDSGE